MIHTTPNRIDQQLSIIKSKKQIGLMTHLVIGYPTMATTKKLITSLTEAGTDFLELQIPFSDPIADGPTIMKACEQALSKGATVRTSFELIADIKKSVSVPILVMCYYNTIFQYGVARFCKKAASTGIHGLIVPDMPIDEEAYERFYEHCNKNNLYAIRVVSPASTSERLSLNARDAKGFVYCVSRFGVTGSQRELDPKLKKYLADVGSHFTIPKAVGFGISNKKHIEGLKNHADVAIVGSAIIDVIVNSTINDAPAAVQKFISTLKTSS